MKNYRIRFENGEEGFILAKNNRELMKLLGVVDKVVFVTDPDGWTILHNRHMGVS